MSYQPPNALGSNGSSAFNFGTGAPATNLPTDAVTQYGLTEPQKSTVPFWDDPPNQIEPSNNQFNPWDVMVFGGIPLPGLSRINSKTHSRYQIKTVKGQNFSTLTFTGYDPAELVVTNRIWTKVQLNMLTAQLPNLLPKFGPQQPSAAQGGLSDKQLQKLAVGVYHPALALYGISAVIILDIDILAPTSIPGVFEQKFHCLQYVPVLKKSVGGTIIGSPTYTNIKNAGLGQPRPAVPPSQGSAVLPGTP